MIDMLGEVYSTSIIRPRARFCKYELLFRHYRHLLLSGTTTHNYNNNTQIAAIALPPLTTHPQLWAELLTFKLKCIIA